MQLGVSKASSMIRSRYSGTCTLGRFAGRPSQSRSCACAACPRICIVNNSHIGVKTTQRPCGCATIMSAGRCSVKMSVHEDIDGNGTEAVTGIGRCVGRSVKGDRSLWFDGSERAPRMATTGSIQKGRSCCLSSREQGQDANDLHGPSNSGSCQGPGQGDLCRTQPHTSD